MSKAQNETPDGGRVPPLVDGVGFKDAKAINETWENDARISELMRTSLVAWRRMSEEERFRSHDGFLLLAWAGEIAACAASGLIRSRGRLSPTGLADLSCPEVVHRAVESTLDYFAGRVHRETARRPVVLVVEGTKWAKPEDYSFHAFYAKLERELLNAAEVLYPHRYSNVERKRNREIDALFERLADGMPPELFLEGLNELRSRRVRNASEIHFVDGEVDEFSVRDGRSDAYAIPGAVFDIFRRMIADGHGNDLGLYLADLICKEPYEVIEGDVRTDLMNAVRRIADQLGNLEVGRGIPWLTLEVLLEIVEGRLRRIFAGFEVGTSGRAKKPEKSEKINKAQITGDIYAYADAHGHPKPASFCWYAWTSRARKVAESYGLKNPKKP